MGALISLQPWNNCLFLSLCSSLSKALNPWWTHRYARSIAIDIELIWPNFLNKPWTSLFGFFDVAVDLFAFKILFSNTALARVTYLHSVAKARPQRAPHLQKPLVRCALSDFICLKITAENRTVTSKRACLDLIELDYIMICPSESQSFLKRKKEELVTETIANRR